MRIDFIDLDKQINHNQKEGANKHSSATTYTSHSEFMQGRTQKQKQNQKRKQTTPLTYMNNKLNNKQITLYIYIVIPPQSACMTLWSRIKMFLE